jgi:glutamyl-Q tRNA(Asp) synthetase
MDLTSYRGRFAPSPTGLLHIGSLATALASWLDAKASNGVWIVRIEDIDTTRAQPDASEGILNQLARFGLISDEKVIFQSNRIAVYQQYLNSLQEKGVIYSCECSRKKIQNYYEALGETIFPQQEIVYPGFCRSNPPNHQTPGALRIKIPDNTIVNQQWLNKEVGDFILQRADGVYSYQLAVVIDDHYQNITHIVRGADLATNTPRQIWLQQVLEFHTPTYLHIPLVLDPTGNKLSKQNKAEPLWPQTTEAILGNLARIAEHLGLKLPLDQPKTISNWLHYAVNAWHDQKRLGIPTG